MASSRAHRVSDIEKLLVLLHRYGDVWGRTRFQKLVFLLKEEFGVSFGYEFIPYRYGPYSHDLQYEIDMLDISDEIDVAPEDATLYVHRLTESGRRIAEQAEQKMDERELSNLAIAVRRLRRMSTRTLINRAKRHAGVF